MLWILNMNLQKRTRECLKIKFKLLSVLLSQFHFSFHGMRASGILDPEPSLCPGFCQNAAPSFRSHPGPSSLVCHGSRQSPFSVFQNSHGPFVSGDVPLLGTRELSGSKRERVILFKYTVYVLSICKCFI